MLRRRELEEREKDDSVIDELAMIMWWFCVIGDMSSIYRPSVMFWTNSLVTPGHGLGITRPCWVFCFEDLLCNFETLEDCPAI